MTNAMRQSAMELHDKALAAVKGGDKQFGYRLLVSAAGVCPDLPEVWYALGNADGDMRLLEGAVANLRRALQCPEISDELRVRALTNLGQRLYHLGRWEEARAVTEDALSLNPGSAYALSNLGVIESANGWPDEALEHCRKGYELSPEPMVEMGLAFTLLYARQWAEGLRHFEARFPYKLKDYEKYPYPRWNGEPVDRLLVASEQGLGDTLSFARFVPMAAARCREVTLVVQAELVGLLSELPCRVVPSPILFPGADAWCPVMSLPTALGLSDAEIVAAPAIPLRVSGVAPVWKTEGVRFHVGLAWAGSKDNDSDRWRSMPVQELLELVRVPGVAFYSLQIGERSQDVHNAGAVALIKDMSPWIRDASDTLAIMRELDLTITVESFLGHLAGMAGLPCWVMINDFAGDWRYGRDSDRPALWYQHRLFRQNDGRWRSVVEHVVDALQGMAGRMENY